MSDKKIIIRNCPCYWHIGEDDGCSLENMKNCEDDTDCVLKQVVKLCKEDYTSENNVFDISKKLFAQRILDKLDVQEVE